jgi:hypothetical protein
MLAGSLGRPLRFTLTPGQSVDVLSPSALLEGLTISNMDLHNSSEREGASIKWKRP